MTLLEKCNADVFKAILEVKEQNPIIGEELISILQGHEYYWAITFGDVMSFAAHLPWPIWDRKAHTFHLLFESKQTTTMP
jgi:hypothetical protein